MGKRGRFIISLFLSLISSLFLFKYNFFFSLSPQDVACHGFASLLYFSASVLLAYITIELGHVLGRVPSFLLDLGSDNNIQPIYKLDIAAVVSPSSQNQISKSNAVLPVKY